MAFRDCILSARDQGAISRDEADDLIERYERFRQARAGDERAAKADLSADLTAQAERKVKLARLQEEAVTRAEADLSAFRTPGGKADVLAGAAALLANENATLAGYSSVATRTKALLGTAHARIEEMMHDQRRTWFTGRRTNKMRMDAVVDAAYGGTDDPAAQSYWKSFKAAEGELLDAARAAGAEFNEIENYLPQPHDTRKMVRAREAKWISFVLPRLDRERMLDPFTSLPFTDDRLREALSIAYKRLVTDGAIDREPTMQRFGRGALANQFGDRRFLVFKDAASWREYQAAFGHRDTFATLMDHLALLARDVAALQRLGPNPAGTLEWLKQVVRSEAAKAAVGEPSQFNAASPLLDMAAKLRGRDLEQRHVERAEGTQNKGQLLLDNMWAELRGGPKAENQFTADFFAGTRNLLTGVQLGFTFWTALATDPIVQARARQFAGLPVANLLGRYLRQLTEMDKRAVLRAGIVNEEGLHHLRLDAGRAGLFEGSGWTRVLPDRVLAITGTTPWTQNGIRSIAADFMGTAADMLDRAHADVIPEFRRYLEGFGIGEREWETIRSAKAHEPAEGSAGLLRPVDILDTARSADAYEVAMRYSEAMHALIEEAVPQGGVSTRAALRAGAPAGTLSGELRRSMIMYLSYSHSFLATTRNAMMHELGAGQRGRALNYAGLSLIGLTLGGFVALQINQILQGKDLAPANDWKTWAAALLKGGGLGVYGDYLLADVSKLTGSPYEKIAGPMVGLGVDALKVLAPGVTLRGEGEKYNRSDNAVRFLERYTPFANSWYTRLAYQRVVTDQLHYLTNPRAHQSFRERERRLRTESGQGYWWMPGDPAPRRAPDLGTVWRP